MRRLRKFLVLPMEDKTLLAQAVFCVLCARVGLTCLGFSSYWGRLTAARIQNRSSHFISAERAVWAVDVIGRHGLWARNCLVKGLAVKRLLKNRGDARLRIDVARPDNGRLRAHAWIEYRDASSARSPIGTEFIPLPAFDV